MIDGFTDAQVIAGLIGLLLVSYAAFFGWLVTSISHLHSRLDIVDHKTGARFDTFLGKVDAKFDGLSAKLDGLTIAVSRLEGAVYHGLPERRLPES